MRPLRLPAILVGDPTLGGISTTLSSYESLLLRGYDITAVALVREPTRGNYDALKRLLGGFVGGAAHRGGRPLPLIALPPCAPPPPPSAAAVAGAGDGSSGQLDDSLLRWLEESEGAFAELLEVVESEHRRRVEWLAGAADSARETVWWPFTQHGNVEHG